MKRLGSPRSPQDLVGPGIHRPFAVGVDHGRDGPSAVLQALQIGQPRFAAVDVDPLVGDLALVEKLLEPDAVASPVG